MKLRADSLFVNEIEKHVIAKHRCMFLLFGEDTCEKVPTLLHLTRRCIKNSDVMKLLWFRQRENTISRKLEKKWHKKLMHSHDKEDFKSQNSLEMMIASSDVTYCGPGNCQKVLGHTYDACIFENFNTLTPNILARCIETVRGGGAVIFLLESLTSFEQLYNLKMDIHMRYKTDWYPDVKPRFNKRLVTSLSSCPSAYSVSNDFIVQPLCNVHSVSTTSRNPSKDEDSFSTLMRGLSHFEEMKPYLKLFKQCATIDQVEVLLEIIRLIRNCEKSVMSLTSGRGRGKSASLGLGLAVAILFGHSNICVTSPGLENVQTLLHFACVGLNALGYKENVDYFIGRSSVEEGNLLVKVKIKKFQKQLIEYRPPRDVDALIRADFLCIDEAAAIPLNMIKKLLSAKLCVISSTIQGYEGTGRSLSLKLLEDIRKRSKLNLALDFNDLPKMVKEVFKTQVLGTSMTELTLTTCIRYSDFDPVELWLDRLFCLSTSEAIPIINTPSLDDCQLYQVDLDALFLGTPSSEEILSSIVAVYVASHYKNSPNDLLMLADAPAHKLFCLLSGCSQSSLQVICVIQVAMEGNVSDESIKKFWEGGERPHGDLMSWIVDQQFPGYKFAMRKGMRIVRIATHSSFQKMGFGRRAMELLIKHCTQDSLPPVQNKIEPPVVFKTLEDAEVFTNIEHIGASFGASFSLIKFWKSLKMCPVYISQVLNEVTGEHSCIFLKDLRDPESRNGLNVMDMWNDFRLRFIRLLPHSFRFLNSNSALEILISDRFKGSICNGVKYSMLDKERARNYMMDRLEMRAVFDLLHEISTQFFVAGPFCNISHNKMIILLAVGVQGKSFEVTACELSDVQQSRKRGRGDEFNSSSVSGLLNKCFKDFLAEKIAPGNSWDQIKCYSK